jgi:hypothetical protein
VIRSIVLENAHSIYWSLRPLQSPLKMISPMTMSERNLTTHASKGHGEMPGSSSNQGPTPHVPTTSTPYHSDFSDRNPYNTHHQPSASEDDGSCFVLSSDSSATNSDPESGSDKIYSKRLASQGKVTVKGPVSRARGLLVVEPKTDMELASSCEGSFVDVSLSEGTEGKCASTRCISFVMAIG